MVQVQCNMSRAILDLQSRHWGVKRIQGPVSSPPIPVCKSSHGVQKTKTSKFYDSFNEETKTQMESLQTETMKNQSFVKVIFSFFCYRSCKLLNYYSKKPSKVGAYFLVIGLRGLKNNFISDGLCSFFYYRLC